MWPFSRRPDVARLDERGDIDGLTRALAHVEPAIRAAAARALALHHPASALAPLVSMVIDPDPAARAAVVEALAGLPGRAVVGALVARLAASGDPPAPEMAALRQVAGQGEARAALLERLATGPVTERVVAAHALGRRGDAAVVAPLIQALSDSELAVVEAASVALVAVGADRALGALEVVTREANPAARVAATRALGEMSDVRALPALAAALSDPQPAVREAALAGLALAPEPGRQIALLAGASAEPVERERVAQRLAQIASVPPLAGALRAVDHPGLRAGAARALGRLGAAEAVTALAGALADPEPAVRREAAWMLGVTGDPTALAPLMAALAGAEDEGTRAAAARALGRLGDGRAIPALEVASREDVVEGTRAAARRAIDTLRTGAAPAPRAARGPLLQAVLFIPDPAPDERAAYASRLLDGAGDDAYEAEAGLHVVTMRPGQPTPGLDEVGRLLRQQFRTAPPGHAWQAAEFTDDQGRRCVLMRLRLADA